MIKGEHCAMCNSNIICEEIKPEDKYCEEVRAKFVGRTASKKLKGVLDECIEKMKEISSTYNIRYFVVLDCFLSALKDEFLNALLGDDEDAKNHD